MLVKYHALSKSEHEHQVAMKFTKETLALS